MYQVIAGGCRLAGAPTGAPSTTRPSCSAVATTRTTCHKLPQDIATSKDRLISIENALKMSASCLYLNLIKLFVDYQFLWSVLHIAAHGWQEQLFFYLFLWGLNFDQHPQEQIHDLKSGCSDLKASRNQLGLMISNWFLRDCTIILYIYICVCFIYI